MSVSTTNALTSVCICVFPQLQICFKICVIMLWISDIAYDIMNKSKLNKLKKQLARLRNGSASIKSTELKRFAKQLGRVRDSRGKEPTYVSELLPYSRPISIPDHPGTLKRFTAENILDAFEQDIYALEEELEQEGERNK